MIDAEAARIIATILVGSRPRRSAFSPDGRRAYVTAEVSGTVSVIDVPTHRVIGTIALEGEDVKPKGVMVSPDGRRILVANGGSHSVSVLALASHEVIATVSAGKMPWGVAVAH